MKFIWIFGPPAVGKMTVGQELERRLGFTLFFNHMTLDEAEKVHPHSRDPDSPYRTLVRKLRLDYFREFVKSDSKGLIFTSARRMCPPHELDGKDDMLEVFKNADCYFIELVAEFEERLKRNVSENRLKHKPTKRDFGRSDNQMYKFEELHVRDGVYGLSEVADENYIKINSTNLTVSEVADRICNHFDFR